MNADNFMAWVAVIALVLSFASFLWQWRSSEGRKLWEADQNRTRNRWANEQQSAQNLWQEAQTKAQVDREIAWRAEDIVRQENLTKPKLDVELTYGFQMSEVSGLSETMLFTDARNVGVVPVYFSNWGGFALPDDKWLDWPREMNPSKYGADYDVRQPLAPASSCRTYVEMNTLRKWLADAGYIGSVEIQGYYTDKLHTKHLSNRISIKVEAG